MLAPMKLVAALACFLGMTVPMASGAETVVLLHGLGRTSWSMSRLGAELERDGYRVLNLSYPSRSVPVEVLASEWLPAKLHEAGVDRAHFVTHSLGGIILRLWVRGQPPEKIGRVVMIAPPNAGTRVADKLDRFGPFRWFTGVNGRRLGTGSDSLPRSLGPWPPNAGELGVIAGDCSLNPLFSHWLGGPNDGKVSVESARLEGMRDFVVLPFSHTWLPFRKAAIDNVRRFLRTGHFSVTPATLSDPVPTPAI
jgi:triacylglycerol lipase